MSSVAAARSRPVLPPGPATEIIFQVLRWVRHPIELMEECAARYGDCFTIRLATTPPLVFFSHPDAVREILTGDPDLFSGGEVNAAAGPVLGRHSLLVLDGLRHTHARRVMLPSFHGERMLRCGAVIQEVTERAVRNWAVEQPFRIHPELQAITLEIILRTVFGPAEPSFVASLRSLLVEVLDLASQPLMRVAIGEAQRRRPKPWVSILALRRELDAVLTMEIARRRGVGWPSNGGVLDMLIEARDESGRPLSDAEVCDELVTLLASGHEATAASLAWVFYRLLTHADVLATLRGELMTAELQGSTRVERTAELGYLDTVIKETLRLHPVFMVAGRGLRQPTRIGGYDLPAGVIVTPCIYLTHRRPDVWPDPERFDPDRFRKLHPSPYQFLPFGGGTRRCLGMAFAVFEMKIVIAAILSHVKLRLADDAPVCTMRRNITLVPSGGVPVVVEGRLG